MAKEFMGGIPIILLVAPTKCVQNPSRTQLIGILFDDWQAGIVWHTFKNVYYKTQCWLLKFQHILGNEMEMEIEKTDLDLGIWEGKGRHV